MTRSLILATLLYAFATVSTAQEAPASAAEPPKLGIRWQHGLAPPSAPAPAPTWTRHPKCKDCLTYHGGEVLATTRVLPIFWGETWDSAAFVQDKIDGLDNWYTNYIGSDYENATMSEYCAGTNKGAKTCSEAASPTWVETAWNSGQSGVSYTPGSYVVDTSRAGGGAKTSAIVAEVCRVIRSKVGAGGFLPQRNDYYPVYVDLPISGGYCAYHSFGTCPYTPPGGTATTVTVQVGFFWEADDNAGCASGDGPFDPVTGRSLYTGHTEGLASLADSSAHELSETRTDPGNPTAWIDAHGYELGDKCEYNTGYPGEPAATTPKVRFPDNSYWVLQPEWSNLEALGTITTHSPPLFAPLVYAEQGLDFSLVARGSYGCVYGTGTQQSLYIPENPSY